MQGDPKKDMDGRSRAGDPSFTNKEPPLATFFVTIPIVVCDINHEAQLCMLTIVDCNYNRSKRFVTYLLPALVFASNSDFTLHSPRL